MSFCKALHQSGTLLLLETTGRCVQDERTRSVEDLRSLKGELARRQEDYSYTKQLHGLTLQEQDAASRLAYEKLLASKAAIGVHLDETEASLLRYLRYYES